MVQVTEVAAGLTIPLTCKIRIFPDLDKTIAYAQVLCSENDKAMSHVQEMLCGSNVYSSEGCMAPQMRTLQIFRRPT